MSDKKWGEDHSDDGMDCLFDFAGYATEEAVVDGISQPPVDHDTVVVDEASARFLQGDTFCLTSFNGCVLAAKRGRLLANHSGLSGWT